jgi:quercetin dioxygenase-like cupin family protein
MSGRQAQVVSMQGNAKYLRLLSGVPQTRGLKSGQVILQPGEAVGPHSTADREEAIIILEGILQVFLEGKPAMTAQRDQLVYIPPNTVHDMKNTGEAAARYVYVVAPVQPDPGQETRTTG